MPHDNELIDVHTHVGVDLGSYLRGWWPYALSSQELLDQMSDSGIDRAVCFPHSLPSACDSTVFADTGAVQLKPGRFPYDRENLRLVEELSLIDTQERLTPFAMFDPLRMVTEQVDAIHAIRSRIRGLKTQTTILQAPIRNLITGGAPLMQLAERLDLPVVVHTSVAPSDAWAQVSDCLEVAAHYPNVRFNLAHSLRFNRRLLEQASRMHNVWVDCSAHLTHCDLARMDSPAVASCKARVDADYSRPDQVLESIHEILKGRYLWGSDAPYMSWCDKQIRAIHRYQEEADVLHMLVSSVRRDMATTAPSEWLGNAAQAFTTDSHSHR